MFQTGCLGPGSKRRQRNATCLHKLWKTLHLKLHGARSWVPLLFHEFTRVDWTSCIALGKWNDETISLFYQPQKAWPWYQLRRARGHQVSRRYIVCRLVILFFQLFSWYLSHSCFQLVRTRYVLNPRFLSNTAICTSSRWVPLLPLLSPSWITQRFSRRRTRKSTKW